MNSTDVLPAWLLTPDAGLFLPVLMALLPVVIFLGVLVWLDSFRLVKRSRVVVGLVAGAVAALVAFVFNSIILDISEMSTAAFAILVAPLVEEICKALWVAWQVRRRQIGFLVDAAILGFATGAGFAIVENIYYLRSLADVPLVVWLIRGLGTALMHGGTTALLAVYLRGRGDRVPTGPPWVGGVALATLLHSAFNRFMTVPLLATGLMVIVLPVLMFLVYRQGELRMKSWLGRGFDRDAELLGLIQAGEVRQTPLGRYLVSLRESFRSDTVTDMLCLLRLQVELSLHAKGLLILREQGFDPAPDPQIAEKLDEVRWLEKSIGRTGLLAMRPICHWRGANAWQRHLLEERED